MACNPRAAPVRPCLWPRRESVIVFRGMEGSPPPPAERDVRNRAATDSPHAVTPAPNGSPYTGAYAGAFASALVAALVVGGVDILLTLAGAQEVTGKEA